MTQPPTSWPIVVSEDLQYILLLFVLFVLPRVLQRFRLPSAISCIGLGALAGMSFGVFQHDATINLLSTFGVVSLFLFAGLDVEFSELRRNSRMLTQHVVVRVSLLACVALLAHGVFELSIQSAVLVALALTTPSTGFILDSLGSLGVTPHEASWIKSKAIATELVALATLFIALQPPNVLQVAVAFLVMATMILLLPWLFRFFASAILPYAPKSEFAFLLMVAVLCALVTRRLGAYYLIGAFVVGVTAQRFRERIPTIASERMVHAVEVFASFFVPFYFFHAGATLERTDFSVGALILGLVLAAVLVPLRVALIAIHRRATLGEPLARGARIGIAIIPTLVFTLVIADILQEQFAASPILFGGLIVYTLINTLVPGFVLRVTPPALEDLHAPASLAVPDVPTSA